MNALARPFAVVLLLAGPLVPPAFAQDDPEGVCSFVPGVTFDLIVSGGTHTLATNTVVQHALITGGVLAGPGDLLVQGTLVWCAGAIATDVQAGTELWINGTADKTLTNGTLVFGGLVGVDATGHWHEGHIVGGLFTNRGDLTIQVDNSFPGNGDKGMVGGVFHNYPGFGTVRWREGPFQMSYGAVLNNGGSVVMENDGMLSWIGGSQPQLNNEGFIDKRGGVHVIQAAFNTEQLSEVRVDSGTLRLTGGGSSTLGSFFVGGLLDFAGGTHTYDGAGFIGPMGGGPGGAVRVSGGAFHATGNLVDVDNGPPSGLTFELTGGTLSGDAEVRTRRLLWTGGTLSGMLRVRAFGDATISGSGLKHLSDGALTNEGAAVWTEGELRMDYGAVLTNAAGATFDVAFDGLLNYTHVPPSQVYNDGTWRKTGGAGTSTIGPVFHNAGVVESASGVLSFDGGGTGTGTFGAYGGGELAFGGGTYTLDGASFTGDGTVGIAGATVNVAGAGVTSAPATTLSFSSGTLDGAAELVAAGPVVWTGGLVMGYLRTQGPLALSGPALKHVNVGTLTNEGQATWSEGELRLDRGAVLSNAAGATFDVAFDGLLSYVHVPPSRVDNAGTWRKTGGAGASTVISLFDNTGTVGGVGTLAFTGGVTNAGTVAPGLSPGLLTWQANYDMTAPGTALEIELGGLTPGTEYDQLAVTGDATLGGTLRLRHLVGFFPQPGDSFTVLTATGTVSGTFAAVEAPGGYGYALTYNPSSVVATVTARPNLDLTATNATPLTVAPGGSVTFDYAVRNNAASPATGQLWFAATGGRSGVIRSGTLPAGQTLTGTYVQAVPGNTPPGTYTYRLRVGRFPSPVADEEAFTLVVMGAAPRRAPLWAAGEPAEWGEGPVAESVAEARPAAYALHAAYPNPFADRATLRYGLPEAAVVRLAVYDVLGREVAVLVAAELEAGRHTAAFDGQSLAAGVYVARLTAGERTLTQRLTLAR